jgi:ubiquinone/menaquinone biosynthesis C-methylase UbiE
MLRQERERKVLELLGRSGMSELRELSILDAGCGTGHWIREFVEWGASPEKIVGVDILEDRIERARQLCASAVELRIESASQLSDADGTYDLVIQATVFSSVLDPIMRQGLARELLRVLRPGGAIVWYDFHVSNPRNQDVRGVRRNEIHELFEGCAIRLERITLAPPLARWLAPRSTTLHRIAGSLPWLRTHYLGLIRKSPGSVDPRRAEPRAPRISGREST